MPEKPEESKLLKLRVSCSNCNQYEEREGDTHCDHCGERLTREWIKKETGNPYDN